MADLDYRIILGSRPIPSLAEQRDQQTARQIQQQEVELRRQEILARRDALREQARMRSMPPPVDEAKAFELRISKAKTLANLLRGADAETYPHVRELARQLVGDDAVQELPEQFDAPTIAALAKFGDDAVAQAVKTREVRTRKADGSETIQIVEDKPGQVFESAAEPPKAGSAPNVGSFEDYVTRTYGPTPTSDQIIAARKKYNQADDRPAVTVRMGNGMTPGQAFDAERQLRAEFNRETKAAQTVQQQLSLMKASLDAVKKGAAPAGSQGVLVTFQKILDPTSVVRESEYARSASGMSLLSQIEGKWSQIQSGGAGVTAKDLEQFVTLAEQFALRQKAFADQTRAQIDQSAKDFGLDPARITRDIGAPVTAAPAGGTTPAPQQPKRTNPFKK